MRALAVLLLVAALPLEAAAAVRTLERALKPRPVVMVVHRYGDVSVSGSDRPDIRLAARVEVQGSSETAAGAFADAVRLAASERGETLIVTTHYPAAPRGDTAFAFWADLDLAVPAGSGVAVRNSFGDVRLADVAGASRLENRHGDVEAARVGDCAITSRYGRVRLEQTRGRLVVNSSYGDVVLVEPGDSARVDHSFGSVEVRDSRRHAHVANLWGDVVVVPGSGAVSVANRWGDVVALVEQAGVSGLDLVSHCGDVRLVLGRGLPFELVGQAEQGSARAPRPIVVSDDGQARLVSGRQGRGGPLIEVRTVCGDIEVDRK